MSLKNQRYLCSTNAMTMKNQTPITTPITDRVATLLASSWALEEVIFEAFLMVSVGWDVGALSGVGVLGCRDADGRPVGLVGCGVGGVVVG